MCVIVFHDHQVLCLEGTPGWDEFSQQVADIWIPLGAYPHWSKEWYNLKGIEDYIKKVAFYWYIILPVEKAPLMLLIFQINDEYSC